MQPGETAYLGDGAYLHFTGYSFEFRANHHELPTDQVSVEIGDVRRMLRLIHETIDPISEEPTEGKKS